MRSIVLRIIAGVKLDWLRKVLIVAQVALCLVLLSDMLKISFALEAERAADPASILKSLNRTLSGVLDGQFVSASCTHFDLDAHEIIYAGAGHPPALLTRHATGKVEEVAEKRPLSRAIPPCVLSEAFAEALVRSVSIREREDDLTVVVAQLLAKGH